MRKIIPFVDLVEINPSTPVTGKLVPFIGMEDVSEDGRLLNIGMREKGQLSSGLSRFVDHDVLFAKITPCMENGKGAYVFGLNGFSGHGSTEFHVLRARNGVMPRFIFYWSQAANLRRAAEAMMVGSAGHRRVPVEFFRRFMVPEFSIDEQRRIVEALDAVNISMLSVDRTIKKLESLLSGLVESLVEGLASAEMVQVGDIFDIKSGITLGPDRAPVSRARDYLRVANVKRASVDLSDVSQLEASRVDELNYALREDDLLVVEGHANVNEIGRCAMAGPEAIGMLYQNHLFRLRGRSVMPSFGEIWLNSRFAQSYWRRMSATSSGLHTINSKMLGALRFPVLAMDGQMRISGSILDLKEKIATERSSLGKLQAIREGLVEGLLSGRVRV